MRVRVRVRRRHPGGATASGPFRDLPGFPGAIGKSDGRGFCIVGSADLMQLCQGECIKAKYN